MIHQTVRRLMFAGLSLALPTLFAISRPAIDFKSLTQTQQALFATYRPAQADSQWVQMSTSEEVEFAGVTRALNQWWQHLDDSPPPNQPGTEVLDRITGIHGQIPHGKPEEQYNIEVQWKVNAENKFRDAWGWSKHISVLHPGYHGYQQNRDGDPFLGLVILFDDGGHSVGQVHIGFDDFIWHYFAVNGSIADNYDDYCRWYGRLDGYLACPAFDLLGAALTPEIPR